jgi:hypothetical protein
MENIKRSAFAYDRGITKWLDTVALLKNEIGWMRIDLIYEGE